MANNVNINIFLNVLFDVMIKQFILKRRKIKLIYYSQLSLELIIQNNFWKSQITHPIFCCTL